MAEDRSIANIAHLLRRSGFGPTAAEVRAAAIRGYEATVENLLDFSGPDTADATPAPTFTPYSPLGARNLTSDQRKAIQLRRTTEAAQLVSWWLSRMATTSHPLREKLTWLWHGHFATSIQKVQRADFMAAQNQTFRALGAGNFESLTRAVATDAAMLIWLDAATNAKAHPNENFARELMELFTLGIGKYSEDDVKQAARAFTGWQYNPRSGGFSVNARLHDDGFKTVLGQSGTWTGDDVIHILMNNAASAPFIVSRLWSHLAYPVKPDDPVVTSLAPAFAADHDARNLIRAILLHPQFVSDRARTGLVKQPIEWIIGVTRSLGLSASDKRLPAALRGLGQVPFEPPSVGGWPQNEFWLTTASSYVRLRFAASAAGTADLSAISQTPAAARLDAVAQMLALTGWSETSRNALTQVVNDPKALVSLALVSPEYTIA